jgi:hypothetical protein
VTGGWAATNTLRDLLWSGPVLGDDNTCFWCGGRYSLGHREDCEAPAALALVEAALDAAEEFVNPTDYRPGAAYRRETALAAALRAVREGA